MKLVQKSLLHTGYFVMENGEIAPAFTDDLITESMLQPFKKSIRKIYGVITKDDIPKLLKLITEFKEKYGIVPQNYTEELRTGFCNSSGLQQTLPRYCYK